MIQIEAMMTVCMNMKKLSFNWMGLLFVQNHICGLVGGGGESIFGRNDFVLNARSFQGNQGRRNC